MTHETRRSFLHAVAGAGLLGASERWRGVDAQTQSPLDPLLALRPRTYPSPSTTGRAATLPASRYPA